MTKTEKNKLIVEMFNDRLQELGLADELFIEPIPNTFKQRPRYGVYKDGTKRFAVQMWQLNELEGDSLEREIKTIINGARAHFNV